mgnify:CR=1 FL=1
MPNTIKSFSGFMNEDDADSIIAPVHHKYGKNIRFRGIGNNQRLESVEGTTQINYTKPAGTNQCIGAFYDGLKQYIYFFNWNSNNNHGIYRYSLGTGLTTALLVCGTNSTGDILNFDLDYPIASVNILYTTEQDGDVLHWIQRNDEAKRLNLKEAEDNKYGAAWLEEYLTVIKAPPVMPIKPVYENDGNDAAIITTTILDLLKTINQQLFSGVTTDIISFNTFASSEFTANVGNTEFTYIGAGDTAKLNITLGYNFNFPTGTVTASILKNGTPITDSIQVINAGFGGGTYQKLVETALATNDVISIRFVISNAISYPTYYFNLSGGTLTATTEYSTNLKVSINNLRNSLFQFCYRYVYVNNEKSVWSSRSIIPLPNQPSGKLTEDNLSNNSRISVSLSTGGKNVYKIQTAFRKIKGLPTDTEWYLLDTLDKQELTITDNDIYTFKFYNDGVYELVDPTEIVQLQDSIPRNPNTQELLNGNVLVLGGGIESYDKVASDIQTETKQETNGFYYDYNGLQFFAAINGNDSGSEGTTMKIFLYGTGSNTDGEVVTLNNGKATLVINAVNGSGTSIGTTYTGTDSLSVATALGAISASLVINGWTQVSLDGNILTMSYPSNVILQSSGTKLIAGTLNNNTTSLANVFEGAYKVGVMYFDKYGRTNGTVTDVNAAYNTPRQGTDNYCQPRLIISHRPPIWATYYQVVRSNNTTYNKRLFWVSESAYSNVFSGISTTDSGITNQRFAYIGIDNIERYNEEIEATRGVVSYDFAQGDRIRFLARYSSVGALTTPFTVVDYEVLGVETSILVNGVQKLGKFVKIYYPTDDISGTFKFDGSVNFLNYEILLYNYTNQEGVKDRIYNEFGKCFGIGNAGTANAYHLGTVQTQSAIAPSVTPAIIDMTNGDLFYRKRTIPVGIQQLFSAGNYTAGDTYTTIPCALTGTPITIGSYTFATQNFVVAGTGVGDAPTNAATDCLVNNTSASPIRVRLRGTVSAYADLSCTMKYIAKMTNGSGVSLATVMDTKDMVSPNTTYTFSFDTTVILAANSKLFLLNNLVGRTGAAPQLGVGQFELKLEVLNDITIPIIESSFSDVYNLITNSNGRVTVVDKNAQEVRNDVLVRWSLPYIQNTNINGSNTFRGENFDEVDREKGAIQRFKTRDKFLRVFQNKGVGRYGIYSKYIRNNSGQNELVVTDEIITANNIQYFLGEFGMGGEYCGLASSQSADYFTYPVTGEQIRLANDGMTNLSETYKGQFVLSGLLSPYNQTYLRADGSKAKILAYYDFLEEQFVTLLQGGTKGAVTINDYAFSFNEVRNGFCSYYDYNNPDWFICAENVTYSWKNGNFYIHNDVANSCKFYGTQYYPSIKLVFNDAMTVKKTMLSIGYEASGIWAAPTLGDIYTSQTNPQTNLLQQSLIKSFDVELDEGRYICTLLRDANSMSNANVALLEGDYLTGFYIVINFVYSGTGFSWLYLPYVQWIPNPRNL